MDQFLKQNENFPMRFFSQPLFVIAFFGVGVLLANPMVKRQVDGSDPEPIIEDDSPLAEEGEISAADFGEGSGEGDHQHHHIEQPEEGSGIEEAPVVLFRQSEIDETTSVAADASTVETSSRGQETTEASSIQPVTEEASSNAQTPVSSAVNVFSSMFALIAVFLLNF